MTYTIFFEIHHKPFEDGTPRDHLVSVELKDRAYDLAKEILKELSCCETDGISEYWEIIPCLEGIRAPFAELMREIGIVGSIWVEYYLRTGK